MIIDSKETERLRREFAGLRNQFIYENGAYCRRCKRSEKVNIVVHHKKPLSEGGTNDFDNLEVLCSECHNEWHYAYEGRLDYGAFLEIPSAYELRAIHLAFNGRDNPYSEALTAIRGIREFLENGYLEDMYERKMGRTKPNRGQ